ncbi:MAG: alpha-ketoglutarate-dependent dioxygenase AlkB family protein [Pseudomonadota bacterium]
MSGADLLAASGRPEPIDLNGVKIWKGWLDRPAQEAMRDDLRAVARAAPFVRYTTPWGKPMSVLMTAAGRLGWVISEKGYQYAERHPEGMPWPPIPDSVLAVWRALSGWPEDPDCCLVNFYGEQARMGLHQDKDEGEFEAPVLSVSLGDPATFRVGGLRRKDPTRSTKLESGDVALLAGEARLAYHGIDRIRFGASDLLPAGGRINLTLRVVKSA